MLQSVGLARHRLFQATSFVVLLLFGLFAGAPASALESRNFVVNWFALAVNPKASDCPGVPFGSPFVIARTSLLLQGYSENEADRLAHEFDSVLVRNNGDYTEVQKKFSAFTIRRGRIRGKSVDPYLNPLAAPNPHIPPAANRMQYGFNLDGKGADDKDSVEDPETHERGVDNEYARAVGCMTPFRSKINSGSAPDTGGYWNEDRPGNRAWLITILGDDLSKEGDVIVLIRRSLDSPLLNSKGEAAADGTFRIDPDRNTLNIFHGKLTNGVVTSIEPVNFWLMNFHDYRLLRSRLRIELKEDGSAQGMIGGYRPWRDIYAVFASTTGREWEYMSTLNVVGLFYNLRDYADGYPDKDGHNTAISSAWKFEALPAFVIGADGKPETLRSVQSYEALLAVQSEAHHPYVAGAK